MELSGIYIGYEPREAAAFAVCRSSISHRLTRPIPIHGLILDDLRSRGLYWREHTRNGNVLFDKISEAPMSTEFAISRFLVPIIAKTGFVIFMDCDIMARANIERIMSHVDPSKAVSVVKHHFDPPEGVKMDGQVQQRYARKNWSSVMVFNCDHVANRHGLSMQIVNTVPGRDLHRFFWLQDHEIGELPPEWNYLVNHTELPVNIGPRLVHWTDGSPCLPGFENEPFADEFRDELIRWAR